MKRIIGIVLIVLGVIALLQGQISHTGEEHHVEVGPVKMKAKEKDTINIPPLVGGLILASGVGLLVLSLRKPDGSEQSN